MIVAKIMAHDIVNLTHPDIAHLELGYAGIIDEEDLDAEVHR